MKGYYHEINRLNRYLDDLVKSGDIAEISEPKFFYELTLTYMVSERAIKKRLNLLKEQGLIIWEEGCGTIIIPGKSKQNKDPGKAAMADMVKNAGKDGR